MSLALGVNYPWVTCGHDLGPRPPPWAGPPTDFARVEVELSRLRALGIGCARFWLLAGGVNYPCGVDPSRHAARRRYPTGFPPRAERWIGAPPALPPAFLEDLGRLLAVCERSGVALWPSLASFEAFLPIVELASGVTSRGRGALLLHRGFFDAVLEPVLDVCVAHRAAVRAVELVNEPDWVVRARPAWVAAEALSAWIAEGAERIARRGLVASVGLVDARAPWLAHGARGRLRRLADRGAYLHQHHHYPSDSARTLPPAWRSAVRPVWLGELPTSRHARWHDPGLAEDDDAAYLAARLALVEARGYEGALLWSVRATDPHTRWDAQVEAQVHASASHAARARRADAG
ncbi:MAG: hypothetical protein KF729_17815 [Sandaracinaceae bacterium]|nr:hypothetical protein [Sandaracinaceae bacterium]